MKIEKFILKISQLLDRLDIPYAISGGVAVTVWGRPRHTADVDVVIKIDTSLVVEELVETLQKQFHLSYVDKDMAISAFNRKSEFNLIEPEYGLKADFFFIGHSPHEQLEIQRAKKQKIGSKMVKFISPEDLIISKLKWFKESQSTRQLEDIASVMDIQKSLDRVYLTLWINKLALQKEWLKAKKSNG